MEYANHLNEYAPAWSEAQVAEEVARIREAAKRNHNAEVYKMCYSAIDITTLSCNDSVTSVTEFARKTAEFYQKFPHIPNVASICIYPAFVETVGLAVDGTPMKITSVGGGFPAAQTFLEVKALEVAMAVENGADTEAREGMAVAQYIAGMGFSNVGLGIVHSMAHPLGAFYDTPHGVANATLLPYVMEYNAESPSRAKYLDIARAMGVKTDGMSVDEGVRAAVDAVKALSLSIRIPQRLHELGVREEDIPALAVAAFNDVCTGGNPRPTSVEEIERLYHIAY